MPELQFRGKEFVHNHHLTVPFRPLEFDAAKGIGTPSRDGNLIIHGDNLHALKALLPTHAGKVDCIFIDPPYNTGNEGWAYNDNVNSPMIREWLNANPIGLEDGLRHDKWACMMWPRLKLLHELLAEDGSFWMTLDDTEIANARLICSDIFGTENFITQIAWQKKYTISNDATYFSDTHDHILCFAKSASAWRPNRMARTDEMNARYRNPDNHPKGPWKATPIHAKSGSASAASFSYTFNNGMTWTPPTGTFPRYSAGTLRQLDDANEIWFGNDGHAQPAKKTFLAELNDEGTPPPTIWLHGEVGNNHEAREEIKRFNLEIDFATPKPLRLLDRILSLATDRESLVLDSFSGSGTTAHAVLAANARDGGNRRFILVEGEEYADTLTAERVRRVINGYAFKGTQRDELLREPLTFSKLKNANSLLEKVQQIETLDGPKYDRIKSTVKDGALIVTGERDCDETAPGLGGSFTYCTLGDAIDMDGLLTGDDLPAVEALAALLYHTATNQAFDAGQMAPAPDIGDGVYRLGSANGRHLWLFYKPDLDWLKSGDAALTLSNARAIAGSLLGDHLVFAPAKFVSRELLAAQRLPVEYAPLPYALYRVETA